jgi:hypothetical protein
VLPPAKKYIGYNFKGSIELELNALIVIPDGRLAFISANKLVTNELVGAVLKRMQYNQKLLMGYHLIISCNHPLIQGCCCI